MSRFALVLVSAMFAACSGDAATTSSGSSAGGTGAAGGAPATSASTSDASSSGSIASSSSTGGAVDPCPQAVACPEVPGSLTEGGGLVPIDRCAFALTPDATSASTFDTIIDAYPPTLARVTVTDIAEDLNRTATKLPTSALPGNAPGVQHVYQWQSGDESVAYWTPQGITGSFDANDTGLVGGRKLVLVSWYYTQANDPGSQVDKGVRIAVADVTDPNAVQYRFMLLVSPTMQGNVPSFAAVKIHAGGLAWVGDRLYVPVTTGGFRVFDLSRILKLDGFDDLLGPDAGHYDAYGYAYAVPEIARYEADTTCAPRFSFVSLDRTSSPPSLVSGEYDANTIHGRLHRWPLATDGSLDAQSHGRVVPDEAWFMGESHIQGGLAHQATFWLSSSRPPGGAGELDRTAVDTPTTRLGWSDSPEDLAFDPEAASIWSLSEGVNARYFFDVALSAVD